MRSPQKAAEIAGVSRRTIMVAIETKAMKASRNNRNHWQISDEDLQAWMASRSPQVKPTPSDTSTDTTTEADLIVALMEEQLKSAQAEAAGYREEIARLQGEHAARMAETTAEFKERLAQRDGDYQQAMEMLKEAQRPRGLWEWLTGARPKT